MRQALSCAHRATQVVIGRAAMLTSGRHVMLFSLHDVCGWARPHNKFHKFSLALRPTHFLFGFHYNEMGTFLEYVVLIYTVPFPSHLLTELQRLRQSEWRLMADQFRWRHNSSGVALRIDGKDGLDFTLTLPHHHGKQSYMVIVIWGRSLLLGSMVTNREERTQPSLVTRRSMPLPSWEKEEGFHSRNHL